MRVLKRAPWVYALVAVAALLLGSPAWAQLIGPGSDGSPGSDASLPPGGGPVPPDALALGAGATILADTGNESWTLSTGTASGLAEAQVYSDPSNVYCAGCLDFVFAVFNNSSSTDALARITAGAFGGFSTDVGYLTNLSCGAGPNINPTTVDRSAAPGNVVGFNYPTTAPLNPGDCTSALVIETNATSFTTGTISEINQGVASEGGYAPTGATVPEPASMALLGTALLGAYGLLRRRTGSS